MNDLVTHDIKRVRLASSSPGSWYDEKGNLVCKTLELPDRNNQRDNVNTPENEAGCINVGTYLVTKEEPIPANDPLGRKERPYGHFRLHNVPGRSGILVHRITYVKDLLGCIGTGGRFVDLNADGIPDVVESGKKLQWMYDNLPDKFWLRISWRDE